MKLNLVTKLGIILIVLIQTVQLAIAQVDLNQTNQNDVGEFVLCDVEPGIEVCEQTKHYVDCSQHQAIDLTHCHTSFQSGLALESSKLLMLVAELTHSHQLTELDLYYPEHILEHFKPPI